MHRLKKARLAKNWTQFTLAKEANIYPDVVSKIERGIIAKPYEKWRKAFAKALDVPEEELFPAVEAKGVNRREA